MLFYVSIGLVGLGYVRIVKDILSLVRLDLVRLG